MQRFDAEHPLRPYPALLTYPPLPLDHPVFGFVVELVYKICPVILNHVMYNTQN